MSASEFFPRCLWKMYVIHDFLQTSANTWCWTVLLTWNRTGPKSVFWGFFAVRKEMSLFNLSYLHGTLGKYYLP